MKGGIGSREMPLPFALFFECLKPFAPEAVGNGPAVLGAAQPGADEVALL